MNLRFANRRSGAKVKRNERSSWLGLGWEGDEGEGVQGFSFFRSLIKPVEPSVVINFVVKGELGFCTRKN